MTEAATPQTGIVIGINSRTILIDESHFFLGEFKTDGIEIGDTVAFGSDAHDWLTSLTVVKKANGSTPAAPPKKGGPAPKAADPALKCVLGECPDHAEHFTLNKQRNRWECNLMGIDNPNITHCPLVAKKPGVSNDLEKKLASKGFGTSSAVKTETDSIRVVGIYVTHDPKANSLILKVNGANAEYSADRSVIQYLESKDSKVIAGTTTVTIEIEEVPKKGMVAMRIGPGPEPAPEQQKPPVQTPAPKADPPAGQRTGTPPAAPVGVKPPQQQPPAAKPAVNNPGAPPKFRKAARKSAKLRIGLCGTAGSGKTWDALQIAFGIGGPIAVIDTENSSAELYAHLGEYDVCILSAPFTAQKYTDAIHEAERAGYNVIVIDSLTHAWAGEGGLLDLKDNIVKNSRSGNSWAAWKDVTPLHRNLVDAMLQSPSHIIATMRSKTEYVIDTDDRGKSSPRKIGMAPVQREGMDYEFTLVFDIDANHIASASKDRTSLFTGKSFMPSIETGRQLKEWLNTESPGGE